MDKNTVLLNHANNIKKVVVTKMKFDKHESEKVSRNLGNRYIEICRGRGIKNSTFEKRISQKSFELNNDLNGIFDDSSHFVTRDLADVFSDEKKSIGKKYDKDKKENEINSGLSKYSDSLENELDRLLYSLKMPDSKASSLKLDIKNMFKNVVEKTSGELMQYDSKMTNTLINYINTELETYQKELADMNGKDGKEQNSFLNTLKDQVVEDKKVAKKDINISQDSEIEHKNKETNEKDNDIQCK